MAQCWKTHAPLENVTSAEDIPSTYVIYTTNDKVDAIVVTFVKVLLLVAYA